MRNERELKGRLNVSVRNVLMKMSLGIKGLLVRLHFKDFFRVITFSLTIICALVVPYVLKLAGIKVNRTRYGIPAVQLLIYLAWL